MRNLLLAALCLFCSFGLFADPINNSSSIQDVTVYRSGARIVRDAAVKIPAGQSEIVFSNLTTQINPHSLQVQLPEGMDLINAQYRTTYLKEVEQPEKVTALQAEIEILSEAIDWNSQQINIYTSEEQILTQKQIELRSDKKGLTIQDLKEYTIFFRERSLEIKTLLRELQKKNKPLNIKLTALRSELRLLQTKKNLQTGEVVLSVQSNLPQQCDLSFSYLTHNAGWDPIYDLKAKDTSSPMDLNLKANIYQNTGIEWDRVKLAISTGNPLLGNDRPILRPKYVNFAPVIQNSRESMAKSGFNSNMAYDMEMTEEAAVVDVGMPRTMDQAANISDTEITREYEIALRQSIPSTGQKRLVQLQHYEIATEYVHHSVPKLDRGAFLLAKVENWGKYNLLPGTANLFFQNTYIGQSQINSNITADEILLSLGRDESIKVKRERSITLEEKTFLGFSIVQNAEYTINVKNTKNKTVELEILDQIPISQHEDIEISLGEKNGAKFDEKTGGLKWDIELAPGESRELVFSYSQKSPHDQTVSMR